VIPKNDFTRVIPTAPHTLDDDQTLTLLLKRFAKKLVNGTYKEIANGTKVDLDA
jgi:glycine C-acetyltransferase